MAADEHGRVGDAGGTVFEVLDPRLTIYALANGMDLVRLPEGRRLEWYRDGRDRGILIEDAGSGSVSVRALTWKRSDPESDRAQEYTPLIDAEELASSLSSVLDGALEAANRL
jgi:hypothetical protein